MSQSIQPEHRQHDGAREEFVLDTDIGTDVDDLLALAMIFGSPELEVSAVTTVYGDVALRARIVAKAYAAAGIPQPSIAPGLQETLSGRDVWWPGHEGSTIADLDQQGYHSDVAAIDLLASSPFITAIGPQTNVAAALQRPDHEIRRVVIMGGEFQRDLVEHNIRCDVAASRVLFESGVPVLAVGLEQTERVRLGSSELSRIDAAGELGRLLAEEMKRFWAFAEQDYNVPHDAIAVLAITRPDLFTTASGTVTVSEEGLTRFTPGPDGPHSIVTDMDVDAVASQIMNRILAAAAVAAAPKNS